MAEEYDFIIVGAGSAGCVLANRLTGSGKYRVLLLEAGGNDRRFWLKVPLGYGKSFYDSRVNWMYMTEPVAGAAGREIYWPRGKVLGGSSSINAMIYIRGQPEDYEDWLAAGNPGWGWRDIRPIFESLEDYGGTSGQASGGNGPLHIDRSSNSLHPLCGAFLQGCEEAGLRRNGDFNGVTQEGAGTYGITVKNGMRMSASRAYLRPALRRACLHVETHAHATRILFEGRKAAGVEYVKGGEPRSARAGKEIILSAGAINSPQLLLLSGIGPAAELSAAGMAVVLDSPTVGRNLQDHYGIDHIYRSTRPTLNNELHAWPGRIRAGLKYLSSRRGPLARNINHAGGFFRTRPDLTRPNMQLYFSPLTYRKAPPGTRPLLNPDPYPGFNIAISQCHPTSTGHVRLKSSDPIAPPAIQPNYLATRHDRDELLDGVKFLRKLSATPTMKRLISEELYPGAAVTDDAALMDHIREAGDTIYHPASTCRMGPDRKSNVVDARLRVHGLDGIRVADASVFPTMPSGNINGPAIMVGEKASRIILEEISERGM